MSRTVGLVLPNKKEPEKNTAPASTAKRDMKEPKDKKE